MTYTKGEWFVNAHGSGGHETRYITVGPLGYVDGIAQVKIYPDSMGGEKTAFANARLIAAAPKLLRLTKRMLEKWVALYHNISTAGFMDMIDDPEQFQNFEHELRAAIAEAEKAE